MKTHSKLAHVWGSWQALHMTDMICTARRAFGSRLDRPEARPLREIDLWSDQAEVAFVEERRAARA